MKEPTESDRFDDAVAAHQSGDLDAAERLYRLLLEEDEDDAVVLELLGTLLVARGRAREARIHLERSIGLDSNSPTAHLAHADALTASGDLCAAERALEACLAIDESLRPAMLRLGTVLAEQGRLKEADRLAGRLRSIDSCSVELRVMEMVLSLARGELSAVLELAAALPHELLEDLSIRSTRVLALAGLGRVEDAERLLSSMPPETATSTEARVLSMFALRYRFEEAAAWWERRRGSSGSSDAPTAIAISGIRAVDPDRADRLQAAIAQRRFGPAAADVIAGMAAYAAGDHRSAAERLGKAVALRPDDVSLIATCASTFNATGRASEAATMLEIARARHPGQVPLLVESARSSLSLHRYHEAEQRFLEAHAHDPAGIGPMRGLAELTLL